MRIHFPARVPSGVNPLATIFGVTSRADALLLHMTLAEKVGQLVQVQAPKVPALEARIRAGRVSSIFSITDPSAINRLQHIARRESRLGIPLLVGNDVIHGYRTIFPIPLAEACSWNPALVEQAARLAAQEARANGTNWIFAPMVDVCREPRWGRIAEGAGEDAYLGSVMAAARVRGIQSVEHVAACPKHYVAYGAVEAGRDYNSVDISERTLRDVYLLPFKAAFDAGAHTVMSSFNDIGGIPSTCNPFTLRTILRDEWGWQGVVASDYTAIKELIQHGVAADLNDAARLSLLAGVDMDMMSDAYDRHLATLVEEGAVPLTLVDEAVRRVLHLKFELGLFEMGPVDADVAQRATLTEEARALALEVARESMVLLKNDTRLLPLSKSSNVAVVGPLAEARKDLLGCWSLIGDPADAESILEGVSETLGQRLPSVASDLVEAVKLARSADVVIAVVGETADLSGEAHCRTHLGLPGDQQALVDTLKATGKPLVVVLLSGRPLAISRLAEQADALLLAWHPGMRAGRAVADVLFGHVNPSAKLAASFPRSEGQIPVYYGHKTTGRPPEGQGTLQFDTAYRSAYLDELNTPLYTFGFGLSYSEFDYADLQVESPVYEQLRASAIVTNVGSRAGAEVAQLYVHDRVASVTRPVRELKAFARIHLEPGESRRVNFEVPVEQLGFTGLDMRYRVEPGEFDVWIGPDSTRGVEGHFALH
jgi:beta-glucosidase